MSDINQLIRDRVDSFVGELGDLVRQAALESVKQALGGQTSLGQLMGGPVSAPRPAVGRKPRVVAVTRAPEAVVASKPAVTKVAAKKRGGKRTAEELEMLTNQILGYVASNPGQGVEMIAKGLATDTKELVLPIKKLVLTGVLRTEGQKRATKYFSGNGSADGGAAGSKAIRRKSKLKRK